MQLPAYERLEDIPSLMPPSFYDAPCLTGNDVPVPVAWKLKDRRPISESAPPAGCYLYHAVLVFPQAKI